MADGPPPHPGHLCEPRSNDDLGHRDFHQRPPAPEAESDHSPKQRREAENEARESLAPDLIPRPALGHRAHAPHAKIGFASPELLTGLGFINPRGPPNPQGFKTRMACKPKG
jgi:hypothetical protein